MLVLDSLWTLLCTIFGVFNILFAVQFARYYKLTASCASTVLMGLLTLSLPTIFAVLFVSGFSSFPREVVSPYVGPVPIQLAIAFLIMYFKKRSKITEPWDDTSA